MSSAARSVARTPALTPAQRDVLRFLPRGGPYAPGELCRGAKARTAAALVRKGLAVRTMGTFMGRGGWFVVSDEGQRVREVLWPEVYAWT